MRRVGAWILLAGFVLLLANLMVFHFYMVESFAVYLIIAIWFIFNNKPLPSRKKKVAKQDESNHTDNNYNDNNYYAINDLNNDSQDSAGTEAVCGDCDSGCDCGDCGDCGSSDSGSND